MIRESRGTKDRLVELTVPVRVKARIRDDGYRLHDSETGRQEEVFIVSVVSTEWPPNWQEQATLEGLKT